MQPTDIWTHLLRHPTKNSSEIAQTYLPDAWKVNEERKYVGKLESVLFNKVSLLPFDNYNFFKQENLLSIFLRIRFHTEINLKGAPNGIPR